MRRTATAAALLACVTALSACSIAVSGPATDTAGNTIVPSGSGASAQVALPANLDVGDYPTTTRSFPAPSVKDGWYVEGNRMGDVLIQPVDVDPRLRFGGAIKTSYPVLAGSDLETYVPSATAKIFRDQSMRVGMTTTREDARTQRTRGLRIGMYRFDSPDAATKAFEAIKASTRSLRPVAISSTPGVAAAEFRPGTVDSYRAQGPFVINISGTGVTTDEGASFVAKAYRLQVPQVDAFAATPTAAILSLPQDRDGILARTLPTTPGPEFNPDHGYFGLPSLLHRIGNSDNADVYKRAGVDLVATGGAGVYRARDPQGAQLITDDFVARKRESEDSTPAAPPAALPQASCFIYLDDATVGCVMRVGRYMIVTSASDVDRVHAKLSAQYALLMKNP